MDRGVVDGVAADESGDRQLILRRTNLRKFSAVS